MTQAGYTADQGKRYYGSGFTNAVATGTTTCGPNANADCRGYTWDNAGTVVLSCAAADNYFATTLVVNTGATAATQTAGGATLTQNAFVAASAGSISTTSCWALPQPTAANIKPTKNVLRQKVFVPIAPPQTFNKGRSGY
jgi:hypothetical protein